MLKVKSWRKTNLLLIKKTHIFQDYKFLGNIQEEVTYQQGSDVENILGFPIKRISSREESGLWGNFIEKDVFRQFQA